MSALSDTITLGLVIILIFGSACLYLYTRIQQCETKINLLESILLDLKMTNELKAYPNVSYPDQKIVQDGSAFQPLSSSPIDLGGDDVEELSNSDISQNLQSVIEIKPFEDDHDEQEQLITEGTLQNDLTHDMHEVLQQESTIKMTPNYEAMTKKELLELAKERNVSGIQTNMSRSKIIQMLKKADGTHVDVLESLAEGSSEAIEASPNIELSVSA